jgi:hypothetical protein
LNVTLGSVTAALGQIGLNGLTVSKDSKLDRKTVRVKVLTEIQWMALNALVLVSLFLVNSVTTALNPRTVKENSPKKKDPALKQLLIAIGVIGPSLVLVLGIVILVIKLVRDNVFVMGLQMIRKVILWIVLILDLVMTLLVIYPPPLLVHVMDLLLKLFLVMISLVVTGVILLNGLLVIKLVVALVDDLQYVPVCLDIPQHLLMIVILILPINLATSMIVPNLNLRMEVIHFQLIATINMIAVILNQPMAILPTVTEEMMMDINTHHLPLKIVKVVNLQKLNHSHPILKISLNVSVLNPMKKKNVIIRPVDSKNANGICGPNGLNVINFATVLNSVDNYASVEMI